MKADRMGTHTEQVRSRMGWISPSVRNKGVAAGDKRLTCRGCERCGYPAGADWLDGGETCPKCKLVQ